MTLDDLLELKALQRKPIKVCLCGSTRFSEAFHLANLRETLAGKIVLSIGCDFKSDTDLLLAGEMTPDDKKRMDTLHLFKIDEANEVLILNVGGYVGESTKREIEYAQLKNKAIRWLELDKLCYCCRKSVTDDQAIITKGIVMGHSYRFCPACKDAGVVKGDLQESRPGAK